VKVTGRLIKDALGWGFALWLIGYLLGIAFFFVLPTAWIGWVVMPIGLVVTFWVLLKRVHATAVSYYVVLAVVWTIIAVAFDYGFIVVAFKPEDGYYKLDVYSYYALTFILPIAAGVWKTRGLRP
jgi:hypothetical protein